jgi:hypothetical protein
MIASARRSPASVRDEGGFIQNSAYCLLGIYIISWQGTRFSCHFFLLGKKDKIISVWVLEKLSILGPKA